MSSPSRNIIDRYVAVRVANQALDKLDAGTIGYLNHMPSPEHKTLVATLELFTRTSTTYALVQQIEELALARSKDDSDTMQLGIHPNGNMPFRDDGSHR